MPEWVGIIVVMIVTILFSSVVVLKPEGEFNE